MERRNKWLAYPRLSEEDMAAKMAEFEDSGGEVIVIPDNFRPKKKANDCAVKIGKVYLQLEATKKS